MIQGIPSLFTARLGVTSSVTLIDSYSEANQNSYFGLDSDIADLQGTGQCFTASGSTLGSCKFYLSKVGAPTGNAVAKLYAISGTFGTTAIPTGTALGTSNVFDVATLTTSFALITFTFSGANQYAMVNGTKYFIVIEYSGGDTINFLKVGFKSGVGTHPGNSAGLTAGSWGQGGSGDDECFYVYST